MTEKSKTRWMRYIVGILFTIAGVFAFIIMDLAANPIISIIALIVGLPSLMWGAILIGRCEQFIENKFRDTKPQGDKDDK